MNKELEELKDLKNAFIGHCRELKCEENYIKVCENKFSKIEKELKVLKVIKPFLKNIRLEENEKGKYEILIDTITNDKPLVIAIVKSKNEYDFLKEALQ